mmetsp:Transcript_25410/g.37992  ORF Transcript_25410/g.37992 Transcript_25410/m.37992 type:complete len:446 (-) Transcript_25410:237-1574(-)|eukprot:CAMPEP_0203666898 /NCGR_PEP_ID=MMETSP0090-20130426/3832_1 /ASSEMBLY_ACC=CAM_ASM_001088 /TAXON_ID=426623 /ORGANISM="Chaetoceros affinis, Strain CCMP159" /LENGTH=445 /DNA_ID=CAMNT_0050530893 /DNA_START=141 /DNA_END=1478 /DNA_ORIENTATION=+
MSTKQPDQQDQQQQNDQTTLTVDTHDAILDNSTAADTVAAAVAAAAAAAPSVDTAGLNSLSEAAMKGIGTTDGTGNNTTNISGINEECKTTIAQVEQVKEEAFDAMMATASATATASAAAATNDSKIDMVLTKLDTILERLNRIEAMAGAGMGRRPMPSSSLSPSPNSKQTLLRQGKTRVKNTCPSMMKTLQGAPINEMSLHFYNNEYHVLPEGWVLPRLSFEGLVQFWFLGDPTAGVPPLIKVGGTEFKNLPRGVRKRSDMKYLMKHVERKGRELGCYIDNIDDWTIGSVRNLFARTKQYFEYPNKSSAQTKFDKLSWETVCHNLRRNKGYLLGEEPSTHTSTEEVEDASRAGASDGADAQTQIHVVNEEPDVARTLIDQMESPIPIAPPETSDGVPMPPPEIVPPTNHNDAMKDQDEDVVMESANSTASPEEPKVDSGVCTTV